MIESPRIKTLVRWQPFYSRLIVHIWAVNCCSQLVVMKFTAAVWCLLKASGKTGQPFSCNCRFFTFLWLSTRLSKITRSLLECMSTPGAIVGSASCPGTLQQDEWTSQESNQPDIKYQDCMHTSSPLLFRIWWYSEFDAARSNNIFPFGSFNCASLWR